MYPPLKKIKGHIALGLSMCVCVCMYAGVSVTKKKVTVLRFGIKK